jgi:sulfur carrier protein
MPPPDTRGSTPARGGAWAVLRLQPAGVLNFFTFHHTPMHPMPHVVINGQSESIPEGITVRALLEARQLAGKRVAVERNGEIVPKGRHGEAVLADGDRLEIVVAVGGG